MRGILVVNAYVTTEKFTQFFELLLNGAKKKEVELMKVGHTVLWGHIGDGNLKEYLSEFDFVLFWDKDLKLAQEIEKTGISMFNSARAIELCDDKALTYLALKDGDVPMPKTYPSPKQFRTCEDFSYYLGLGTKLGYPLVFKECMGSFGAQVYLIHKEEELISRIKETEDRPFILQEYIGAFAGEDIRIQVVGNKVVAAMKRTNPNDFRANITNGGDMECYTPTEEEASLALKVCRKLGLSFGGIDLLFDEDRHPVFCEANSNAHFQNLLICTGIDTSEFIFDYIKEQIGSR